MYKWLFILDRFWSDESNTKCKYNIYRFKSLDQATHSLQSLPKTHVWIQPILTCKHDWEWIRLLQILWSIALKLQISKDDDKKEWNIKNIFKCQIFIQHFFKIVLYWCLDLIRHNIGTKFRLNKYIHITLLYIERSNLEHYT
jgi:hypothetical protein